jgi:pantoate--beta-alanine ligase
MIRVESAAEMRRLRKELSGTVGFVPTMGALHEGHYSLVGRARRECDFVIASIFVNPAQFNDPKDLEKYPRPLERDLAGLEKAGVDYVFLPKPGDMYADDYRFEVREKEASKILCGAHRPGHFEGVLTVVMKLFNLVKPDKAYFGEKDYQQLRLISDMASTFFMDVEVVPCPTLREADGLAMSSRNLRLSPAERERAPLLYRALKNAATPAEAARELENAGFKVDYVEEKWGRRLGAAFLGEVRLIDNVAL